MCNIKIKRMKKIKLLLLTLSLFTLSSCEELDIIPDCVWVDVVDENTQEVYSIEICGDNI